MTLKRDARGRLRDYKKEYRRDHSSPEAKAKRAALGKIRKKLQEAGRISKRKNRKGKNSKNDEGGSEVSHLRSPKRGGSLTGLKNIRVVSRRTNRKQGMKTVTNKVKKAYKKKAARR